MDCFQPKQRLDNRQHRRLFPQRPPESLLTAKHACGQPVSAGVTASQLAGSDTMWQSLCSLRGASNARPDWWGYWQAKAACFRPASLPLLTPPEACQPLTSPDLCPQLQRPAKLLHSPRDVIGLQHRNWPCAQALSLSKSCLMLSELRKLSCEARPGSKARCYNSFDFTMQLACELPLLTLIREAPSSKRS